MAPGLARLGRHLRRGAAAYGVLSIALLLTLLAFYYVSQNVEAEARTRFDENTLAAKTVIYRRVNRYLDAMFGARGLFAGGGPVGREEWSGYVRALEPERRFRLNGFQSLSFAKYLGPGEKEAYLRKEGLRDLWPEPEGERTAYFPLTFVSPSSVANRRMISYDAYSDPVHRSVIERARDTGLPQATRMDYVLTEAPLDSGKEVVWRKGIVVYLPVYEENEQGNPLQNGGARS
jgi:CHASE1-domain containing sensor protein